MSKMLKSCRIVPAGMLAVSLALSGCGSKSAAGDPPMQTGPEEVGVVTLEPQRVTITSELPGRTAAYMIAEVRPQVGGIVQKRFFTEGADVKAGDALYQIDPASYQAAYAGAKAALNKAEAVLATIRSKVARYKELLPAKAVSHQDYEDLVGQARQAEADVEAAKAALETARINLDHTRVTSPISGRVGKSSVTTGALVTANQSVALCTVQQLDPIYVDVTQSTASLLRLKQSMAEGRLKSDDASQAKVGLILEDGSSYPTAGSLKFSDVTVDWSTGSVTLRSVFSNPAQVLLPGMYVRAVVEEGTDEQAILAPQRGVSRDASGNATALVVGNEERVESRVVQVSRAIGDQWLVTGGLEAGDRLIVEGVQKVRAGMQVKAAPFGGPESARADAASTRLAAVSK